MKSNAKSESKPSVFPYDNLLYLILVIIFCDTSVGI